MVKLYFKQAWNLFRQERLFSLIYVVGTGLSVSVVMVLSIVFYLKTASIYPETNRDRMLIAASGQVKLKAEGKSSGSSLSEQVVNTCFGSLKGVEAVALIYRANGDFRIRTADKLVQFPVTAKFVNTGFWTVFPFRFLSGQPFTAADQQSGLLAAVISGSLAQRLFGTTDAIGRYVTMNYKQYRVCGVVKDASPVTIRTFASIWIPYTANEAHRSDSGWERTSSLGSFNACLLAAPGANLKEIKAEAQDNVRRYSQTLTDAEFTVLGQPDYYWQSTFRASSNTEPNYVLLLFKYSFLLLILLLVPAVNLSGMTDSRMERRLAEMGVRRAFGAPVRTLMNQIVTENFLFTLLGGLFGLGCSYLLLYLSSSWIMQLDGIFVRMVPEETSTVFTPAMLLNYRVFVIALLVCFVLNLLSALIPAWRASHRQIIRSLNTR